MRKPDGLMVRDQWGGFWLYGPEDTALAERRQHKQSDEYGNLAAILRLYALTPAELQALEFGLQFQRDMMLYGQSWTRIDPCEVTLSPAPTGGERE